MFSGVARIWCRGGTKLRENNLKNIRRNIMKLRELLYSNCGADVTEYAEYATLVFYWIGNHMESNVRVCAALK